MYIEVFDQFQNPVKIPATRVVVYDDFGNPITAVLKVRDGYYVAATAGSKRFEKLLHVLGIRKTLVVDVLNAEDFVAKG